MTWRPGRRFRDDERGTVFGPLLIGPETVFSTLVAVVLGLPLVAALAGAVSKREHAFQYVSTAAASLVAVFTLTGTTQFAPRWTVVGILAILTAIAAHVWQFRHDRLDAVVAGSIYFAPVALGYVLLARIVVSIL
ncbi:hypothetical protein [Halorientalis salina]|uniref:hypothetical protein n=1 Tax=Halorientalis salina TaxID=2932266 RepID=UPI0010AC0B7A|nr:hypothetical protein [Halorientalis salina]